MNAIKQIIIGLSIGFISIAGYLFLSVSAIPKTDMFLTAANFDPRINPAKKIVSKIYVKIAENKSCSTDGYDLSERLIKENERFLFVAALAEMSVNDKKYRMMDKEIISKELDEAAKYCRNFAFDSNIDSNTFKYSPPVYIILSRDVDYFEIIARNCVSFDTKYNNSNKSMRTPRDLLQNLIYRSEGKDYAAYPEMTIVRPEEKDHAIYTEMMNSLRRNEVRCSGK